MWERPQRRIKLILLLIITHILTLAGLTAVERAETQTPVVVPLVSLFLRNIRAPERRKQHQRLHLERMHFISCDEGFPGSPTTAEAGCNRVLSVEAI